MFAKQLRSLHLTAKQPIQQAAQQAATLGCRAIEFVKSLLDATKQGIRHVRFASNAAGEQLDSLFHVIHRVDVELAGLYCRDHFIREVELLGVGAGQQNALLPALAQAEREDIRQLSSYQEGTAGAVMSSEYATLKPELSVREAINMLRLEAPDTETIYFAYVLDEARKLLGVVSLKQLILAQEEQHVSELMATNLVSAYVDADQDEAAKIIDGRHCRGAQCQGWQFSHCRRGSRARRRRPRPCAWPKSAPCR